jgi:hypothetical protein
VVYVAGIKPREREGERVSRERKNIPSNDTFILGLHMSLLPCALLSHKIFIVNLRESGVIGGGGDGGDNPDKAIIRIREEIVNLKRQIYLRVKINGEFNCMNSARENK